MQKFYMLLTLSGLILSCVGAASPEIVFLKKTYRLGSFNQKAAPQWEYVSGSETVNNWTSLITLIERADAHSAQDLDRLAQGVMDNYKNHGGRILLARTMHDSGGKPYNYMVAAFDEPAAKRMELNFVKLALGSKNAYIVIYGARVADANQGKALLNEHSSEIGRALEAAAAPDFASLPRRVF